MNVLSTERFISPKLGALFGARSVARLTDALRGRRPCGENSHGKSTYHDASQLLHLNHAAGALPKEWRPRVAVPEDPMPPNCRPLKVATEDQR